MEIPDVFKRLVIDNIIKLQTPESKLRSEAESPRLSTEHRAKRLHFEDRPEYESKDVGDDCGIISASRRTFSTSTCTPSSNNGKYLDQELERLKDERDTLTILIVHKKNDIKDMRVVPETLPPCAIPGGVLLKTICDKCHHRGHKATANRGWEPCPFDACEGYCNCGVLSKHKQYKASITEVEKEVSALEKDVKKNEEKINGLQTFLQINTSNFFKTLKPRLQMAFKKYRGKDGNQLLQKDLRYIKLATHGQIPANITSITPEEIESLIKAGEKMVSTKFELDDVDHDRATSSSLPVSLQEKSFSRKCSRWIKCVCMWYFGTAGTGFLQLHSSAISSMYPYMPGIYPFNTLMTAPYYPGMWYGSPAAQTVSKAPNAENEIFPPLPTEDCPPRPPLSKKSPQRMIPTEKQLGILPSINKPPFVDHI